MIQLDFRIFSNGLVQPPLSHCMENPPKDSFSFASVFHWERLCNFQGNDAVEVGIVPVSEVEENELGVVSG